MRKEDLKITDNDKMRIHYRKRSGKNMPCKEYANPPEHDLVYLENATEEEKQAYAEMLKNGQNDKNVYHAIHNRRGKTVIVDPKYEKARRMNAKIEKTIYLSVLIVAIIAVLAVVIGSFINSTSGQKLINSAFRDKRISSDGNYNFGSFEGYVTIGTSYEEAVEILGLPVPGSDNQLFYGNSYIIIENDAVVGYHKDGFDYFPVTVGFRDVDINPVVTLGDTAGRVVSKLGSPDTYHKYRWTYKDMNPNFLRSNYSSGTSDLVVVFNEDYLVIGYDFIDG